MDFLLTEMFAQVHAEAIAARKKAGEAFIEGVEDNGFRTTDGSDGVFQCEGSFARSSRPKDESRTAAIKAAAQ